MFKSSSYHCLNADKGLNKFEIYLYYKLNRFLNRNTYSNFKNVYTFDPKLSSDYEIGLRSPARILSDLFWEHIDWEAIKSNLGNLSIIDIGCGKGNYLTLLEEVTDNAIDDYIGFDIKERKEWAKLTSKSKIFAECRAEEINFKTLLSTYNIIISQSALEHIEGDVTLFKNIAAAANQIDKNILQIHLVPPPSNLRMYGLHGVRQYTQSRINRLFRFFDDSFIDIYALGNSTYNELHMEYVRNPSMRGEVWSDVLDVENYNKDLMAASAKNEQAVDPTFFAVVIFNNFEGFEVLKSAK